MGEIEKAQAQDNRRKTRALAARLWRDWIRRYWRRLLVAGLFMALLAATSGLLPVLVERVIGAFSAADPDVLWLAPVIIALQAARGGSLYVQTVLTSDVALRVIADLQKAVFAHLQGADLARLTREPVGGLISRFTSDADRLREGLVKAANALVRDVLTLLALVGAMLYIDWVLTIAILLAYPIVWIPVERIGRGLRNISAAVQRQMGDITSLLGENLAGARMVKTHGLEAHETARADAAFEDRYHWLMRGVRARGAIEPLLEVAGGVAVAGVVAFVGYRIASGAASTEEFAGVLTALLLTSQPIRSLGSLQAAIQEGAAALERLFDILDEGPKVVEAPGAAPLAVTGGHVRLRDVSFTYDGTTPALDAVTIEAKPGQSVALVGASGAGKSTVFNLLPRLYDVSDGVVEFDGQDVRDVTLASLRAAVAVVSQDVVLFNDTIAANIEFGRLGASQAEIEEAARAAFAHGFITALPQGYDTIVGDRGLKLSGGQRQRIALARAILKDAPILLLDEATSALDAESEQAVQTALARLSQGRTTIAIAHRLATVRGADLIYVMEAGRVVEQGTHAELLTKSGVYAGLAKLQFRDEEVV